MDRIIDVLAKELSIKPSQAKAARDLLDEGNTVPFIARYRKEVTGGLSDEELRNLSERLVYLRNLEARRGEVARLLCEMEKLSPQIEKHLERANTLQEVEDIYRPFRPKRKTRGSIARQRGLEPVAEKISAQREMVSDEYLQEFIDPKDGVETLEDVIQGALDIIAEDISDDAHVRKLVREITVKRGLIRSKGLVEEVSNYSDYYDYSEPVEKIVSHRILAINRGEREEFLQIKVETPVDEILSRIKFKFLRGDVNSDLLTKSIEDSYKRLIAPSIEREVRNLLTERAQEQALSIFSRNLKNLLLQSPLKDKVVLGFDPAYRTGCKVTVVSPTGLLLDHVVCYPTPPQSKVKEANRIIRSLIEKHSVEVIALGNGTASRESERFLADLIKDVEQPLHYVIVSEAGASIYSASELGAQEFPELDVSFRGAVSIARRLQDPLAELVKIDPKALGVGQYQHDVNQRMLSERLAGVVEECVNSVGVDVQTASPTLLGFVSGVNATIAKNIVKYREEVGRFKSRKELLKVARLGPKTFEQCAGFIRVPQGANILDNTAVHPESYSVANKLMKIHSLEELKAEPFSNEDIGRLARELGVGTPTLKDIISELKKPGRDPREGLPPPVFRKDVMDISDLSPGMSLSGTVRNITDFGAFIDIGVHQDGLAHISELSEKYVRSPFDVLNVGDTIKVKVLSVDVDRNRIGLTLKGV